MIQYVFNANEVVKVKLTEYGREILQAEYDRLNEMISNHTEFRHQIKEDEEGYVSFQLWKLMNIFGPFMELGHREPFSLDIVLMIPTFH